MPCSNEPHRSRRARGRRWARILVLGASLHAQSLLAGEEHVAWKDTREKDPPLIVETIEEQDEDLLDDRSWIEGCFVFDLRMARYTARLGSHYGPEQYEEGLEAAAAADREARIAVALFEAAVTDRYTRYDTEGENGMNQPSPGSFEEYLDLLRFEYRRLSLQPGSRLLLLSLLGEALLQRYGKRSGAVSHDEMLLNLRSSRGRGGVCRDIHGFLGWTAEALGFEDVGMISLKTKDAEHAIAHYRAPSTRTFYVQNYAQLVNTKVRTVLEAVDIATRIMGPLTGVAWVESKAGRVHQYPPRAARWARRVLEQRTEHEEGRPLLAFTVGNTETDVGLEYADFLDEPQALKLFFQHASYLGTDGHYSLTAAGLAGRTEGRVRLGLGWIDAIGASGEGYLGYHYFGLPNLVPEVTRTRQHTAKHNLFTGARVHGWARRLGLTVGVEAYASTIDVDPTRIDGSPPLHYFSLSVEYIAANSDFTIESRRTMEIVPDSLRLGQNTSSGIGSHRLGVVFDRLRVRYRPWFAVRRVKLDNSFELYLFEGIERSAAVGLRDRLELSYESRYGILGLGLDASLISANRVEDPFYDVPFFAMGYIQWRTLFFDTLEIGARIKLLSPDRPHFLLEALDEVEPVIGSVDHPVELRATVWASVRY